jgi:hypothetical protein
MRALSGILILLSVFVCHAQDDVITGFTGNGIITWTNSHSNGLFNVEWSASADGPWQSSWTGLWNLATTASTVSAAIPMFYRVSWSTNVTIDLHISPAETTIGYIGNLVRLTATGGDGSYQWDVYDIALGQVNSSTGTSVLYERGGNGDNAVTVQSTGLQAYAVIHQP